MAIIDLTSRRGNEARSPARSNPARSRLCSPPHRGRRGRFRTGDPPAGTDPVGEMRCFSSKLPGSFLQGAAPGPGEEQTGPSRPERRRGGDSEMVTEGAGPMQPAAAETSGPGQGREAVSGGRGAGSKVQHRAGRGEARWRTQTPLRRTRRAAVTSRAPRHEAQAQ